MAMNPHPNINATMRGLKSRAGLRPAMVKGAKTLMAIATEPPIQKGAIPDMILVRYDAFRLSVIARMVSITMKVPITSTPSASPGEIEGKKLVNEGLGKYSPKHMADASDPGAPRVMLFLNSKALMELSQTPYTISEPINAPKNCAG